MDVNSPQRTLGQVQENLVGPADDSEHKFNPELLCTYPYEPGEAAEQPKTRACVARCGFKALLSEFPLSSTLKPLKTCMGCLKKQAAIRAGQWEKENIGAWMPPNGKQEPTERPPTLTWATFLSLLKDNHGHP